MDKLATKDGVTADIIVYGLASIIVMTFSVYIGAGLGAMWFVLCVLLCAPSLAWLPAVSISSLFAVQLFYSLAVSYWSMDFDSRSEMSVIQGVPFIIMVFVASISYVRIFSNKNVSRFEIARLCRRGIQASLIISLFYLIYGAYANSASSAIVYFRSAVTFPLQMAIGLYVGFCLGLSRVESTFKLMVWIAIFYGVCEVIWSYEVYTIFNADRFFSLKYHRFNISSVEEYIDIATRPAFNLAALKDLDFRMLRISGPNMHSISFAYLLITFMAVSYVGRGYLGIAFSCFLIFFIQGKGAISIVLMTVLILIACNFKNAMFRRSIIALISILYVSLIWFYGLKSSDYHVLGLQGGVNGFFRNPLGHGLGAGGNLVGESLDWQAVQNAGAAAFGVESAVGVLLYQMGIGALPIFAFSAYFSWKSFTFIEGSNYRSYKILPLMFYATILNAFFQEEALNAFAMGLTALLTSTVVGQIIKDRSPFIVTTKGNV